jgi:hypothetical protein
MKDFNIDDQPVQVRIWYASLPVVVQERVHEYPPGNRYMLTSTHHVVRLYSYEEGEDDDGCPTCDECQVLVLQEDNGGKLHHSRRVFGIKFEDLEPIPEGFEPVGDRPLEEMPPDLREKVKELIREETN